MTDARRFAYPIPKPAQTTRARRWYSDASCRRAALCAIAAMGEPSKCRRRAGRQSLRPTEQRWTCPGCVSKCRPSRSPFPASAFGARVHRCRPVKNIGLNSPPKTIAGPMAPSCLRRASVCRQAFLKVHVPAVLWTALPAPLLLLGRRLLLSRKRATSGRPARGALFSG
jgi:hypothetical protein